MASKNPKIKLHLKCSCCGLQCMKQTFVPPSHTCAASQQNVPEWMLYCKFTESDDWSEHSTGLPTARITSDDTPVDLTSYGVTTSTDHHRVLGQGDKAVRGIVIFGKPHSGKTTIIKDGFFPDKKVDEKREDSGMEVCKVIVEKVEYHIVMIDSFVANVKSPEIPLRKLYEQHKDKFPKDISLVLFVFRQGRFTVEEKTFFDTALKCFQESASKLFATIITDCDGQSDETKDGIVEDFKGNPNTKDIGCFMDKGVYCVSFPDTSKVREELKEVYKSEIPLSQKHIQQLLHSDTTPLPTEKIFKQSAAKSNAGLGALFGTKIY